MGERVNPWCHWPNPPWKFNIDSSTSNPPDVGLDDTNLGTLPAYLNSHAYIYSGVAAPVPFFRASVADRPLPMSTKFVTTLAPSVRLSAVDPTQTRSWVFYQNEKQTPLGGPFISKAPLDPVPELQGSNETNVTDVGAMDAGDTHENTEEINALLDSDSDVGCEKAHEFNKTRKSPVENDTMSVESVASANACSGAARPAKKRKLSSGTDKSAVDTASSVRLDHSTGHKHLRNDDDAQSCCIGEVESDHRFALTMREGEAAEGDSPDDQKRRRERIQETVAALRKIVPGGIAKDATAVLDEAICYLKYLKLKVKTLGAVSL